MTCSLVARCPYTGQFGVAAVTAMPAVGKLLSHALAGVGAAATQAKLNPYLAIDSLALLQGGLNAREALERVVRQDPRASERQLAVVDRHGTTATWTGQQCPVYAGAQEHEGFSVQGNRLVGPEVLDDMAAAFMDNAHEKFDERLIGALEVAVAAGGDLEGEVSAAILIVDTEEYPLWDIRVDDHDDPVGELRRLHDIFQARILPEINHMPTRKNPAGGEYEAMA